MIRTDCARWLAALLPMFGTPACSRRDPPPPPPNTRIALVEHAAGDPWAARVRNGAARAAREARRIQIDVRTPVGPGAAGQVEAVRQAAKAGVGAIIIAPDSRSGPELAAALAEAHAAGIELLVLTETGASALESLGGLRVSSDDEQAGTLGAEFLIQKLGGSGTVIILGDGQGSDGADRREIAFRQRISREPGITIHDAPPVGEAARRAAQLAVEYALDAHPGARAVFCPSEQTTLGALQAVRDRSLLGQLRIVGVDSNATLVEAMAAGEVDALVVRDADTIGYHAVRAAIARMNGDTVRDPVLAPVILIPREAMHARGNMDLLLPEFGSPGG